MGHICVQPCQPIPGTVEFSQPLTIFDIQLLQIIVRAIEILQLQMRHIQLFQRVLGTIQIVDSRVLAQFQLGQLILIVISTFPALVLSQVQFLDRIVSAIQHFQVGERLNAF